jgi:hypothetical protein
MRKKRRSECHFSVRDFSAEKSRSVSLCSVEKPGFLKKPGFWGETALL